MQDENLFVALLNLREGAIEHKFTHHELTHHELTHHESRLQVEQTLGNDYRNEKFNASLR